MATAIIIVAIIFVAVTNAAPLNKTCMELLNSTGPYDYCNKITNTSQGGDGLNNLIILADDVADTFVRICNQSEYKKVSICRYRIHKIQNTDYPILHCRFVHLLVTSLIIHMIWEQIEMCKMTASMAN